MPIIPERDKHNESVVAKSTGIISPPKKTHGNGEGGKDYRAIVIVTIAVVLIAGVATVFYIGTPFELNGGGEEKAPAPIDKQTLSLNLDRMIRVGGMIDLTSKKIANLQESLRQAERLKDEVLIDTIRLGLASNLESLETYRTDFVTVLNHMHTAYVQNPSTVKDLLNEKLKTSHDMYKVGNIKTVNMVIKWMENVPESMPPKEFFKQKIQKIQ